ncbi:MAG: GNAT family N-acetyltransferase [Armatimonadetes bacterium]|nr:GNAT family N-acetyltransferase [Armatimonadota bacterium]
MLTFRPFQRTDEEYAALVRVYNVIWPDRPTTLEAERFSDETRDPQRFFERFLVSEDGKDIGYATAGESSWSHREGKYFVGIEFVPGKEGCFHEALDFLKARIADRGYNHLVFWTRSDKVKQIENYRSIGAENTQRQPISELDLPSFDPAVWSSSLAQFRDAGFAMRTHAEMNDAGFDWRPDHYALECELWEDVPYTDTITMRPFEEWLKSNEGSPDYRADLNYVAFDGDRMIGMSHVFRDAGSAARLFTGLTGVLRDFRRKGVATALKVACLTRCKELGFKVVETDNEEKNPMLDLNIALGFRKVFEWMQFELKLPGATN